MLIMALFAFAYYQIATMENRSGLLWAGVSVACWFVARALHLGYGGALILQAAPFVMMTAGNMMKK